MSGPNNAWDNSSDVLQGISSTPQADLSPHAHDLTAGDPASFLGFQFGAGAADPSINPSHHHHASFLNQWLPPKQSTSPIPQLEYSHYSSARFMSNQDSWNPLQVTGVPANVTYSMRPFGRAHPIVGPGLDRRCSDGHHSTCTSSETGETASQYNGLHSSDSGYSSQSWATRSVAASYAVDSACSPLAHQDCEQDEKPSIGIGSMRHSESLDLAEQPASPSPSLLCHDTIKCDYPGCLWIGKCPSDKRKHEARHKKLFKCDEPNCTRKEGFGTINDLARHKKCVHKKEPERGPKVLYMCFGQNCPRSNKKWPRLDNFRQHLARMHSNEDLEELLRRSHEWYQNCVKPHDIASLGTDSLSETTPSLTQMREPEVLMQDADHELHNPFAPIRSASQSSNSLTIGDNSGLEEDHDMSEVDQIQPQPMELSGLSSLELEPTLEQHINNPSQFIGRKYDKMDDMVSEAAHSVINAMTKMINNRQRRRSHLDDETLEHEGALSDRNREILQRILSTASEILAGGAGPDNGNGNNVLDENANGLSKTDWIQCEFCSKQTRLRCEMKKHQKRHERPYGCTFSQCEKTFGSKADWKRHEQSRHFGVQSWQCTLPTTSRGNKKDDLAQCARIFKNQDIYIRHLGKQHGISGEQELRTLIVKDQLGWNGEPYFWCGFCRGIVRLTGSGFVAWDERFDHIDGEHFGKGGRVEEWFPSSGKADRNRDLSDADNDDRNSDVGMDLAPSHSESEQRPNRKRKLRFTTGPRGTRYPVSIHETQTTARDKKSRKQISG
ncbi:putative C2H2 finger domain protein [Aspergillus stella-maris]|uniref:putative C2H2 finger domain protein n=1 Tax=Aspergillus stella-maris TaxID=1810926 RepID=UPI003CCD51E4